MEAFYSIIDKLADVPPSCETRPFFGSSVFQIGENCRQRSLAAPHGNAAEAGTNLAHPRQPVRNASVEDGSGRRPSPASRAISVNLPPM